MLLALKIRSEAPVFVTPKPVPEITELNVTSDVSILMVLFAVKVMALERAWAVFRLMLNVPPPKLIALTEAIAPLDPPFPICKVPALMVVVPL